MLIPDVRPMWPLSINALMYESKDRASEMIVRLSEFLRLSLDNTGEREISLGREIDFIDRVLKSVSRWNIKSTHWPTIVWFLTCRFSLWSRI